MAFAHQQPGVYLETNVRAVCLHDLFPHEERVPDRVLEPLVADVCPSAPAPGVRIAHPDPLASLRDWYYAFLDYGAHLKSTVVNPSRRSSHYARQSAFEGSRRQKRSWIVRRVLAADAEEGVAVRVVSLRTRSRGARGGQGVGRRGVASSILDDLVSEGFFPTRRGRSASVLTRFATMSSPARSSRRVTRGRVNTLPERAGAILIGKTSSATNRRRTVFNVGVRRRFFYAEVSGDAAKCGASANRGLR